MEKRQKTAFLTTGKIWPELWWPGPPAQAYRKSPLSFFESGQAKQSQSGEIATSFHQLLLRNSKWLSERDPLHVSDAQFFFTILEIPQFWGNPKKPGSSRRKARKQTFRIEMMSSHRSFRSSIILASQKFQATWKKSFFSNFPGTVIFPFQPCQAKCKDPDFLNAKTGNAMFHP